MILLDGLTAEYTGAHSLGMTGHFKAIPRFISYRADCEDSPLNVIIRTVNFTEGEAKEIISILLSFVLTLFLNISILLSAIQHPKDFTASKATYIVCGVCHSMGVQT